MLTNPKLFLFFLLTIASFDRLAANDLKNFDDSVLYRLGWPGNDVDVPETNIDEEIFVTTHKKEKYRCTIPHIEKEAEKKFDESNPGPTPGELLVPLFLMSSCSFRLESYWTYEVCHGRFIKQFHEEREGKMIKSQEYFLGLWNQSLTDRMLAHYKEHEKETDPTKLQYVKVEGGRLPAVEVEMVDGTLCDLNGEPRTAKVFYVCDQTGKNEVYSLKETTTCNYEIIILTQLLCSHPMYKPKQQTENPINCYPVENAGKKPRALLQMEAESLKTKYQRIGDIKRSSQSDRKTYAVLKVDPKDGFVKMEFFDTPKEAEAAIKESESPLSTLEKPSDIFGSSSSSIKKQQPKPLPPSLVADRKPVEDFLQGKHCLSGGSGWWKYELCYGRHVRQYHIDRNGETSIVLGKFNAEAHIAWLEKYPNKRPQNQGTRRELSYLYTGGSMCDKTGTPRQTEVRLRCLEKANSMSSVALFLIEPRTCEYELNVESPIICDILESADENGIVLDLVNRSGMLHREDEDDGE